MAHQILSQAIDVFGYDRVVDNLRGVFYLVGIRAAHSDLLVDAVPVAYAAIATYIAIADGIDVIDAAIFVRLRKILIFLLVLFIAGEGECRGRCKEEQEEEILRKFHIHPLPEGTHFKLFIGRPRIGEVSPILSWIQGNAGSVDASKLLYFS